MKIPEGVQPIRAVVFESDHDMFGRLSEQLMRLGGKLILSASNQRDAEGLVRSGLVRAEAIDVAFIGSLDNDASGSDAVVDQMLRQCVIRSEIGPYAPIQSGYEVPNKNKIVSVGMDAAPNISAKRGFHSEFLGGALTLDWSQPDLGLPPILLEVMNLKPLDNPNRNLSVHIPDPRYS